MKIKKWEVVAKGCFLLCIEKKICGYVESDVKYGIIFTSDFYAKEKIMGKTYGYVRVSTKEQNESR